MDKINFVNGRTPALNATNLNQMQTNIETFVLEQTEVATPTKNGMMSAEDKSILDTLTSAAPFVSTQQGDSQIKKLQLGWENGWVLHITAISGTTEHNFIVNLTEITG